MDSDKMKPGLLDDLPRGRDAECVGIPPHSYFESPQNLAATESLRFEPRQNLQAKLFLGVVGGTVVTGPRLPDGRISRYVVGGTPIGIGDDRHHCLIAGSRAGKGRSVLVPLILTLPASASLLILDPKAELTILTALYRAEVLQQMVCLFDPFEISGSKTGKFRVSFNAIDILLKCDPRLLLANARLIADSLIVSTDFQESKHWDDTAKQILAALCIHVATYHRYEGIRDLVTVWRLACELATASADEPGKYWLEKEMLANEAPGVKLAARQFYDRTGAEFSSVASNLRRQIEWISDPCIGRYLTGPSIDLRDLKRKAMTLYVSLPAMRMSELSGLLRLVVQLTLAALEEEAIATGSCGRRVFLLLDEFHVLGRLSSLEVAAAQFASLATMVTVLQDLGQLKSRYPKSWETFIGNSGAIQVFGLADDTTLSYISKRLGQSPTITRSTNAPSYDQASQNAATGESWSLGVHPLLTAEEVGRFFSRDDAKLRQLILRPGYRPAVLMRAFYDKHEIFRGRYAEI